MNSTLIFLSLLLCSCAEIWNTIPDQEKYNYHDKDMNRYKLKLIAGKISGPSEVIASNGDTVELLKWDFKTKVDRKNHWKTTKYFAIDTVFIPRSKMEMVDSCDKIKRGGGRTLQDYRAVIDHNTKQLDSIYLRYSKIHRFGGEVKFQLNINQNGIVGPYIQ